MIKKLVAWISVLFVCVSQSAAGAQDVPAKDDEETGERHFESLTVGALSFTNVWVHRQTNEVILIRHSMGIHSIRLSDLPTDELQELKSQVGDLAEVQPAKKGGWNSSPFIQKILAAFNGGSGRTKVILGIVVFLVLMLIVSKSLGRRSATAG